MIALLLACSDLPEVAPAEMMTEPTIIEETEAVVVELEELPVEPAEDAVEVTDWTSTLPAEDQIVIGIVNDAVDEAVDRTVADLLAAERIRPSSVPVVGFLRDLAKLALGLGLAVMLARARRPKVDVEAIADGAAERILGRANVVARESEVGRLAELDRLRIAHAEARAEVARLRQRPEAAAALPGLEDPEARRRAVEEAGRAALRRRR